MIYIAKDSTNLSSWYLIREVYNCDKNILYHPIDTSPNITSPCGIHLWVGEPALKSDLSFETSPVSPAVQDLSSLPRHHPQPAPKCTKMHQMHQNAPVSLQGAAPILTLGKHKSHKCRNTLSTLFKSISDTSTYQKSSCTSVSVHHPGRHLP